MPKKNVLVVHYSQTGQMRRIAEAVVAPLRDDDELQLDELMLTPQQPYPFPWPLLAFLDGFPEAVWLDPPALRPWQAPQQRYDLIIIAYTVWFLSPAPPITAFLKSAEGRDLLRETPVVTLISCRNMWVKAHEAVSGLLTEAGARHIDNAVLTDPGSAMQTFITTPRWMFTGRQDAFWGMEAAGIPQPQIEACSRFGHAIVQGFADNKVDGQHSLLHGLNAVQVDDRLIPGERIGHRSFRLWGALLRRLGGPGAAARKPVLLLYLMILIILIVTVVPLSMALRAMLRPFRPAVGAALREQYAKPSGSGAERMQEYQR